MGVRSVNEESKRNVRNVRGVRRMRGGTKKREDKRREGRMKRRVG